HGSNPANLQNDQRGIGFQRLFGGKADIGAYEDQHSFEVIDTDDTGDDFDLRHTIGYANANPGADTITFNTSVFSSPKEIVLVNGKISISEALAMVGPGPNLLVINGGNAKTSPLDTGADPDPEPMSFSGMTFTGFKFSGAIASNKQSIIL